MLTALFGITDGSLNLVVNLLILVLVVTWIALIWWTYADASRRINDPVLVATATAASLFPFIGTVVYSILRPPEFLADAQERELEMKAASLRLRRLTETSCPRCEHSIELSWLRCPECQHRLKDPCRSCGRPVDPRWSLCPYCETAIAGPVQTSRGAPSRQRPARSKAEQPASRKRPAAERKSGERRSPAQAAPKRRAPKPSAPAAPPQQPAPEPEHSPSSEATERPARSEAAERSARRKPTPKS